MLRTMYSDTLSLSDYWRISLHFKYCSICPERKGLNHIGAHFSEEGNYEFDKDYEKIYENTSPYLIWKKRA